MESRAALVAGKQITKAVSLLKPLSSGGMGAVWLADHHGLKTRVVVKFMLVSLDASDSARTRFSREAAAAAQVKSPHVVQMLDHGVSDDGVPFIVMEHLEGHDLGDEIKEHGALDPAKVVVIVGQVAKALSKVHAAGLLHRDIKPDNIYLCDGEEDVFVKLLDFGIAKSSAVDQGDGSLDGETKTGQIVGTPFYMSPEQVTAQKLIDNRSDLWALGVVAFEALTGQRPYDGPSFGALAVKIATGSPPKPTEVNPSLPTTVDLWFAKACARDPRERFASAKEMAEAFRAAFEGVISLPSAAVNSDSGQRERSSSGARARAGSGSDGSGSGDAKAASGSGPRPASPTFGLAATALDDSDAGRRQAALGRSEAGVSIIEDGPKARSSPLFFVGGAVALTIAVGGVLVWSARTPPGATTTTTIGAPVSATPTTSTTTSVPPQPSASSSSVAASVADATAPTTTPAPTTSAIPTNTAPAPRPTSQANGSGGVAPRPTVQEPTPKPTAKPTSSEPDLF